MLSFSKVERKSESHDLKNGHPETRDRRIFFPFDLNPLGHLILFDVNVRLRLPG